MNKYTYHDYVTSIQVAGIEVNSRHGKCIEYPIPRTLHVEAGLLVKRLGINYSLGWMEMLQFIGGVFDPDAIKRVAPRANHELFTSQMAYGPRVVDQVPKIIEKLRSDPMTRQAIMFIGHPDDGPTDAQPCTVSMQFILRHGVLRTCVTMRSWDLVKGIAYDVMMFSGMLNAVANVLGAIPGALFVTAGSPHIYVSEGHKTPMASDSIFSIDRSVGTEWSDYVEWARAHVLSLPHGKVPDGVSVRSYGQ